ncbi:hypothetical protein [Pleionea litopenaei]|uniref:Uncharacterized protein n=1 Tax=Pleionea litopenaei TaxID=3070815 RepID=A0AA51X743_9GAMM|nr:hypothetical protein [Pleionea sp. HL-JVS1]WMS86710.1 hypothetical protein Q9312_15930 [Pleionea sp. HL-JVS1]
MSDYVQLAKSFCIGQPVYDMPGSLWRQSFEYIQEYGSSLKLDKNKVHDLWTVLGGCIRNKIRDDKIILDVLMRVLPGYSGPDKVVYRGECKFLFEQNRLGFCWTTKKEVAELFASGRNRIESGGVLLKALAPSNAILAAPNSHSSEFLREDEYTCNPTLLLDIDIIKAFS